MSRATQVLSRIIVPVSPTRLSRPSATVPTVFGYGSDSSRRQSYYPAGALTPTVWAPARSLATTCAIIVYFLFLRVLRCFSSPRSPHITVLAACAAGFPHSEIRGSKCICHSPRLIAAYHVLLRLREPQASPMRPSSLSLYFFSPRSILFRLLSLVCQNLRPIMSMIFS